MEAAVKSFEEIDVAQVMAQDGAEEAAKKVEEIMSADPKVGALMEAAKTVEDAYEAVKTFLKVKWEEFKVVFQKTVDYFKEDKMALDDEVLNSVAGGSWGNFWEKCKKALAAVTVVACIAGGAAIIGFDVAGPIGAAIGAVVGAAVATVCVCGALLEDSEKNYKKVR